MASIDGMMAEVFDQFDKNKLGHLGQDELTGMMERMNQGELKKEVAEYFLGVDKSETLARATWLKIMQSGVRLTKGRMAGFEGGVVDNFRGKADADIICVCYPQESWRDQRCKIQLV